VIVYRITYNLIAIPAAQYFHPLTLGGYGYGHRFHAPFYRTDTMKLSSIPSAICLWYQLSEHLATALNTLQ
jgi:hypothetical protein